MFSFALLTQTEGRSCLSSSRSDLSNRCLITRQKASFFPLMTFSCSLTVLWVRMMTRLRRRSRRVGGFPPHHSLRTDYAWHKAKLPVPENSLEAEYITYFNEECKMARLQLDLSETHDALLEKLRLLCDKKTKKDVVEEALMLMGWAAAEASNGLKIAAVDDTRRVYKEVHTSALEGARQNGERRRADEEAARKRKDHPNLVSVGG